MHSISALITLGFLCLIGTINCERSFKAKAATSLLCDLANGDAVSFPFLDRECYAACYRNSFEDPLITLLCSPVGDAVNALDFCEIAEGLLADLTSDKAECDLACRNVGNGNDLLIVNC